MLAFGAVLAATVALSLVESASADTILRVAGAKEVLRGHGGLRTARLAGVQLPSKLPCTATSAAAAWRGLWIGIGISAWLTLMSELVPEQLLARATSIDFFGSIGLTPVGYVLAGAVATVVAPTTILAVGGTLGALLWFVPLGWRRVRMAA